ncbi:MAG: methyltransferase domain-containing protein [Patescibacteria group bacterium]
MQRPFEKFEEECMRLLAKSRIILDVGGGKRFMKGMKKFELLFCNCEYRTLDSSADYGPDILGDIHALPLADNSIDGVICRSVLEHVERPWDALREIHRVLKNGGLVFIQVPSIYPYHARTGVGAYPDYWRFFESTIRLMSRGFENVTIQKHGGWFHAMSRFLPLQAKFRWLLDPSAYLLDSLFRTEKKIRLHFIPFCCKNNRLQCAS